MKTIPPETAILQAKIEQQLRLIDEPHKLIRILDLTRLLASGVYTNIENIDAISDALRKLGLEPTVLN
jgi:hypothetical protein